MPVIVAIAAVSALMQMYQSEKARGATNKRLKEIQRMFDGIVPPDFNIGVWDDPALVKTIPEPAFNMNGITPELYKSVGEFRPEIANLIAEAKPELVKQTQDAKEGSQAQLDALRKYKQIAASGQDPELDQALAQAAQKARVTAQSRGDSILQDANRRGQLGSNMMVAAQENAASEAMQRQALESQGAAVASYKNKLGALDKSAALGGDIRQQSMAEESKNVGIINDFNERTSARRQQWENARADALSNARLRNLQSDQQISDANVALKNKYAVDNLTRNNQLKQQGYENQRQTRGDKMDVEDRKNRLKQQMYANLMAKANGKAGLAQTGIDYMRQDTADRNRATQGVADAATIGALYYGGGSKGAAAGQNDPMPGQAQGQGTAYSSPQSDSLYAWDDNQSRQQPNNYNRPYTYDDYLREKGQ